MSNRYNLLIIQGKDKSINFTFPTTWTENISLDTFRARICSNWDMPVTITAAGTQFVDAVITTASLTVTVDFNALVTAEMLPTINYFELPLTATNSIDEAKLQTMRPDRGIFQDAYVWELEWLRAATGKTQSIAFGGVLVVTECNKP